MESSCIFSSDKTASLSATNASYFTPELARKTIERLKQISDIEIEISGGINLENITEYSPYSNLISLSGLTMSAPPVDFSLHVI